MITKYKLLEALMYEYNEMDITVSKRFVIADRMTEMFISDDEDEYPDTHPDVLDILYNMLNNTDKEYIDILFDYLKD